jgi:hypothetical protein
VKSGEYGRWYIEGQRTDRTWYTPVTGHHASRQDALASLSGGAERYALASGYAFLQLRREQDSFRTPLYAECLFGKQSKGHAAPVKERVAGKA